MPIADGWSLWPWIQVRGAGFPARVVLALADAQAVAAADAVAAALAAFTRAAATASLGLHGVVESYGPLAKEASRYGAQLGRCPTTRLATPPSRELVAAVPALDAVATTHAALVEARARLAAEHDAAIRRSADVLRGFAREPRFREALAWQNRTAVETALDWVLRHPEENTNKSARKKFAMIASYVQRYFLKNDTIGFFGPTCWGRVSEAPRNSIVPGPDLLRRRELFFEHWAIDAVADVVTADPEARPYAAPRLVGSVAVEGTTLRYGFDRTTQLPVAVAELLRGCDGDTSARALAAELVRRHPDQFEQPQDVYDVLAQFVQRGLMVWSFEASAVSRPERRLRDLLVAIDDPAVRARALAPLDRLDAARARVQAAAGDVPALLGALDELTGTFVEVTGKSSQRNQGETYAGRTAVYEDCQRDLAVTLGRPVVDRLGPVLALIAESCRWFTHEIAQRVLAGARDAFRRLAADGTPVRYMRLWREIQHLIPESHGAPGVIQDVARELGARWREVLDIDARGTMAASRIDIPVADLRGRVADLFAAPGAGWPLARYASPDMMIAAAGPEALDRGEFTGVIGEVHCGNTHFVRALIEFGADDEGTLLRRYEAEIAQPRIAPVETRGRITRADMVVWSPRDYDLEVASSRSWRSRDHVVRAVDLIVEEAGERLVVRDPVRGTSFDLMVVLETYLSFIANNSFKPAPTGPHVPRVTIDGVVLCREQWRFERAELDGIAPAETAAELFAAVRAWARAHGLPRFAFYRLPSESKPLYVDFDSPSYVDTFGRHARATDRLSITEMLPSVEDTWLPDRAGETYTCELRFVMLDPQPWAGDPAHARR